MAIRGVDDVQREKRQREKRKMVEDIRKGFENALNEINKERERRKEVRRKNRGFWWWVVMVIGWWWAVLFGLFSVWLMMILVKGVWGL